MLSFLRGRKQTRNVILIVFIFAMVITLVAFFTASRGSGAASANGDNGATLAKVDSLPVTMGDFKKRLRYVFPNDSDLSSPETMMAVKMRGLDKTIRYVLIKEKVVELEAERLNLQATDEELADRIAQMFSDGNGKFVGATEYKNRLVQRGTTWQDFEKDLR